MMKTFWFDGQSAAAHGLVASGSGTFNAAERDVETVAIPGRNGDLIIDNGRYKNIPVEYPVSICSDFAANAERARAWLGSKTGYCRLEDDWDPDHYRLGRFQGPLEFSPGFLNRTAEGTVRFDCKPQRFLKTGEFPVTVSNGMVLRNPTGFPALPLIKVIGDGWMTLMLGPELGIRQHLFLGTNWFDCESLDAWSITAEGVRSSSNRYASLIGSGAAPELGVEATTISWEIEEDGSVDYVEIIPRWWTL